MRIVLLKDVSNLGKIGETKDVAPGFARNFLFPHGLAVLPDDPKAKEIAKEKTAHRVESKKEKQELKTKISQLDGRTFNFQAKSDKKGNLYGSIGPKELADIIGVRENLIKKHFKTLGTFPLEIKVGQEAVKINIVIEKEK